MKKTAFIIITLTTFVLLFYSLHVSLADKNQSNNQTAFKIPFVQTALASTSPSTAQLPKSILFEVGFISQAPTGHWQDPRLQDGCEEAAALMAVYWSNSIKNPGSANNEKKIIDISNWEKQKYNEYRDTSLSDTANHIMKEYLQFDNFQIKSNVTANDIISELSSGNIVMIAVNGKKLNNPNFKQSGPINHTILIVGYDKSSKEFIANDPGTRLGKSYRYSTKTIENALRDYPTGYHDAFKTAQKNMVVIKKNVE